MPVVEKDTKSASESSSASASDNCYSEESPAEIFSTLSPPVETNKDAIRDGSQAGVEDPKAKIDKQKKAKRELREEIKKKDRGIAKLNTEIDNLPEQQLRHISSPEVEKWAGQRQNLREFCKQLMSDKKDLQKRLNKAHSKIEKQEEQLERSERKRRQKQTLKACRKPEAIEAIFKLRVWESGTLISTED